MMSAESDVYAECYPGLEMNDAIDDSDDEVDYTKMDLVSGFCFKFSLGFFETTDRILGQ